jgi:xanthine dehydrogenase accessory factor
VAEREQPWRDEGPAHGRILVLSANPISAAIQRIGAELGRAVVVCDHDAPDAPQVLRDALVPPASYVVMTASRRRAAGPLPELEAVGVPTGTLHVPAGHDQNAPTKSLRGRGGKGPGEIALSVVAEIVAESYGRPGGPLRG